MIRYAILFLPPLSLLVCSNTVAGNTRPEDFAYGSEVSAPAGSPLYKLVITEDVYRGVKQKDLRDLRVFNKAGDPVPNRLEQPALEIRSERKFVPLVYFPIEGSPVAPGGGSDIEVSEDGSGRVVKVRFSGAGPKILKAQPAFLLDLRSVGQALSALEFQWTAKDQGRVIPVLIEASDDLKNWNTVSNGSVLAKLAYRGEKLEQNRIDLFQIHSKYLKITFDGRDAFKLDGVSGEFVSAEMIPARRAYAKLAGQMKPMKQPGAQSEILFDAQGAFPVDSVKVHLADKNIFLRLRLLSGDSPDGPWRDRYTGSFFRVAAEGGEIASPTAYLGGQSGDRYWLMRIESKETSLGSKLPELELGWIPHQLTFLAQGEPPFRLAYGSAMAEAPNYDFSTLTDNLRNASGAAMQPAEAQLIGLRQELGGTSKLSAPPVEQPAPWKKWALWLALGGSVALVAGMAWKLYEELNAKKA